MVEMDTTKKQLIVELTDIRQRISEFEQLVIEEEHPEQLLQNLLLTSPAATYITQYGVCKFVSPQLR